MSIRSFVQLVREVEAGYTPVVIDDELTTISKTKRALHALAWMTTGAYANETYDKGELLFQINYLRPGPTHQLTANQLRVADEIRASIGIG